MNIGPRLKQTQSLQLRQVLSPQLIQMLKTFNYSYLDFAQEVANQASDNVLLDIQQYDQLSSQYGSGSADRSRSFNGKDISDFAEDRQSQGTLYDYLMSQLSLEHLNEKDTKIAELLIEDIDARGYIPNYTGTKSKIIEKLGVADRKVGDILKIIHTFEPEGVGARTLKECLQIQVQMIELDNDALRDILLDVIAHHLDDLGNNKHAHIAESLGIEADGVAAIEEFIKTNLNPTPGAAFENRSFNDHVIPSFEVRLDEEEIHVDNLEEKYGIQVRISDKYLRLLEDPNTDAQTKEFLKDKLKSAKELIDNIEKRRENLDRLAGYIVKKQANFIRQGTPYLVPLLQKEVAQHIGISSSTVSRIVSSKYIQTPNGVFSLKQLCPRSHFGKTAERLKLIVQDICRKYPDYSDEKIRDNLVQQGIPIARRTVTKYRRLAGEASSFTRSGPSSE